MMNEATGKCPVCTINLYGEEVHTYTDRKGQEKTIKGFPAKMPCCVGLFREGNRLAEDKEICPYETQEDQKEFMERLKVAPAIAGVLGTMHGSSFDD